MSPFSFLGSEPAKQSSAKTPFRPDVPCETQDPPNLNSEIGPAPATNASGKSATVAAPDEQALIDRYSALLTQFDKVKKLQAQGSLPAAKQLLSTVLPQFDGLEQGLGRVPEGERHPNERARRANEEGRSLMRKAIRGHLA